MADADASCDPDDDTGLFLLGLTLSDSEDGAESGGHDPGSSTTAAAKKDPEARKAERTALSEADFLALKSSYRAKVEDGDIYKTIALPLAGSGPGGRLHKMEAAEVLHAVEELYYLKRYAEGEGFVRRVLQSDSGGGGAGRLDEETVKLLGYYGKRCRARIEEGGGG